MNGGKEEEREGKRGDVKADWKVRGRKKKKRKKREGRRWAGLV